MGTNNHPSWIVPLDIARKLKEIGMTDSDILVCTDGSYGWYRDNEIYDYDNDGEFIIYTALDASNWENPSLEPTFTWEQVFEWFRKKGYYSYIVKKSLPERYVYYINYGMIICSNENLKESVLPKTHEEAREELVNKLIELYENK